MPADSVGIAVTNSPKYAYAAIYQSPVVIQNDTGAGSYPTVLPPTTNLLTIGDTSAAGVYLGMISSVADDITFSIGSTEYGSIGYGPTGWGGFDHPTGMWISADNLYFGLDGPPYTQEGSFLMSTGNFSVVGTISAGSNIIVPYNVGFQSLNSTGTATSIMFMTGAGASANTLDFISGAGGWNLLDSSLSITRIAVNNTTGAVTIGDLAGTKLPVCETSGALYAGTNTAGVLACP
jgi:hypothetical protein